MNLNQVTLPSLDLKQSVKFYQLLGLELIVDSIPRYARLLCPDGDSSLSLHTADRIAEGTGITLYFECEHLEEEVARLKAAGLQFDTDIIDQQWLWREIYLKDPDGHQIILFHAGENRINPPWRVKGNKI
jgi:catechol 2,3-dioxygenase-like lactoylglutathione lyase family enzyme